MVATIRWRWHRGPVAWIVQHYITLAGAGTLWDPDPHDTPTGEFALDGAGAELPLLTVRDGGLLVDTIVVDGDGNQLDPGNMNVDLAFSVRTVSSFETAGGPTRQAFAWTRGIIAIGESPGIMQREFPLPQPSTGSVIVVDGSQVPSTGRLAVRAWVP